MSGDRRGRVFLFLRAVDCEPFVPMLKEMVAHDAFAYAKSVVSPMMKTDSDEVFDCMHNTYLSYPLLYGVVKDIGEEPTMGGCPHSPLVLPILGGCRESGVPNDEDE